jgi:D-arabinose 1-dehydrogenase-like Zn-dependent alcohol dehydrogenase
MATPETIRIVRPHVGRDRAHLARILELVASGAVRPPEIATMAFADLPAAHERIETGHVRGKIVLSPVS